MWTDVLAWLQSTEGMRILDGAIVPFVAILLAGIIAALIARSAVRGLLRRADRQAVTGAVAALVEAARRASQGDTERSMHLESEGDVRLRLTALPGSAAAADWAAGRIQLLRSGADPSGAQEVRDTLLAWVSRPKRARRLFTDVAPEPDRMTPTPSGSSAEQAAPAAVPDDSASPVLAAEDPTPPTSPMPAARHVADADLAASAVAVPADAPAARRQTAEPARRGTFDEPAIPAPEPVAARSSSRDEDDADDADFLQEVPVRPAFDEAAEASAGPPPVAAISVRDRTRPVEPDTPRDLPRP